VTVPQNGEIPKFDLAEEVMAEQRKITATRRKAPTNTERRTPNTEHRTPNSAGFPEQRQIIAEIVARDIAKKLKTQS